MTAFRLNYAKGRITACQNRRYRCDFEARRVLALLPAEFTVGDLRGISIWDVRGGERRLLEGDWAVHNFVKSLAKRGFVKRIGNCNTGKWVKL